MTKTRQVLLKIQEEWGENWDQVVDFFGVEIADMLDEASLEQDPGIPEFPEKQLIPGVNCNEEPKHLVFNEVEHL